MTTELRHGIFLGPWHPLHEDPALCLQRDLQLIEFVEQLGFAEAWVGEHHSSGWEIIGSPEVFLAAAAERTKRIRLGTGVVSLAYHHPYMVAERILLLDHLTRGRIMFGAGPGVLPSDAHMLGINPSDLRDRMAESLDVIIRLLRGETVTAKTDWFELQDASLQLQPYQRPLPEIAVASVATPSGGRLAGRYGVSMLCMAASDLRGFDALEGNWDVAVQTGKEYGNTMNRSSLRLCAPMHIAETREQARENVRYGLQEYCDYSTSVNGAINYIPPPGKDIVDHLVDNGHAAIGTPEDAIKLIERLLGKQGDFGCFLNIVNNWADHEQTLRSYELYAHYVVPHFSGANKRRRASYDWVGQHRETFTGQTRAAKQSMIAKHAAEQAAKHAANGATADTPAEDAVAAS